MSTKPIPRHRGVDAPALLQQGFRPFFLAAGLWAVLGLSLWLASFWGWLAIPSAFDGYAWHMHEMLFGFVAAAIAGFVLTAIPNWTGRLPLQGWPLFGLVALWIAGRAAVAFSAVTGPLAAAIIDTSFLAVLTAAAAREIIEGKNWRNLPVIVALALLAVCNALFHSAFLGWEPAMDLAWRFAVAVVLMLIALIGGRVIPSFTGNWLAKRDEARPPPFGAFDKLTLLATALALALWAAGIAGILTPALLALAAVLNACRLGRWRGHRTLSEPLLWILHLGYAWLPVGLGLLAAAEITVIVPRSAGVHALTAGTMAVMILAVSTRAILGHTGRPLHADAGTAVIYVLAMAAALARVVSSLWSTYYTEGLAVSAAFWLLAFLGFLVLYGPKLVLPRPRP